MPQRETIKARFLTYRMGLKRREATKICLPYFPPLNMISAFTGPLCDMAGSLKGAEPERTTHSWTGHSVWVREWSEVTDLPAG